MMSNITDKQLEKMEKMIRNIQDHRHLTALEIGKHLHLSMSFVQRALDILRERQRLPARSAVNSIDLARYRKLDRLMLVTFQPDMSMATAAIYGDDNPKARHKLRCLVDACREDGLDMTRIKHLDMTTKINNSARANKLFRYVAINQVDPETLAHFINICQMNGGRHAA